MHLDLERWMESNQSMIVVWLGEMHNWLMFHFSRSTTTAIRLWPNTKTEAKSFIIQSTPTD
jgi:hypothetical protein